MIYSGEEVARFISPFQGGYRFEYAGEEDFLTDDGKKGLGRLKIERVLKKLSKKITIDWLDVPIFLLPYTLRIWKDCWDLSYLGRAYPTHVLLGPGISADDIVHEFGHIFCFRFIDDNLRNENDSLRLLKYKELRGITHHHNSDYYDLRPGEIFAEDFRYLLGFGKWTNSMVSPPERSILEWIKELARKN